MAGAVGPCFSVSREKSDDVRWALENAATAMIARRALPLKTSYSPALIPIGGFSLSPTIAARGGRGGWMLWVYLWVWYPLLPPKVGSMDHGPNRKSPARSLYHDGILASVTLASLDSSEREDAPALCPFGERRGRRKRN